MPSIKMKPCPFCNSTELKVSLVTSGPDGRYVDGHRVLCLNCRATGPTVSSSNCGGNDATAPSEALERWNQRS